MTFEELEKCIAKDMPKPPKRKKDEYNLPPDFWNPLNPNMEVLKCLVRKPVAKVKKTKKQPPCKRCKKQSELCTFYPCIKFIKFTLDK